MHVAVPTAADGWRRPAIVAMLAALACFASGAASAQGMEIPPLDYRLPLMLEEIYIQFAEQCDGFMGFTLAQGYPEWMTITRPYLTTRTVLVTTSAAYRKLADVPV